jgi:hypothetical protein
MINVGKKNGSVLAYGLIIMTVASILFTSIIEYVVSQIKYGSYTASTNEALHIAETGANFYRWYLYHNIEDRDIMQIKDFWESGNPIAVGTPACGSPGAYEVEYNDPSGAAIGKYCLEVTPPPAWSTMAIVKSVGWTYKYPDTKKSIQVRLRRPAWSEYMVLAEGMFRLSDRTEIYGKMHSNTGIHFDGVIHNLISCEISQYYDEDYNTNKPGIWTLWSGEYNTILNNDVFMLGKNYPADHHDFNAAVGSFDLMEQEANAGRGKYFNDSGQGRRIILKNNGTYDICTVNSYNSTSNSITDYVGVITGATRHGGSDNGLACVTSACCLTSVCASRSGSGNGKCVSAANFSIVNNGVIYVNDNVWLEGQINGKKITIAAYDDVAGGRNVYLYNNLLYTNYDGTDVIGVMAQNNIEIVQDSLNTLRLDGAFMAKEGRLGRNHYSNTKNSVTIYGSIATNGRINFGYTDGTGYTNRYLYFDNNLIYYPPPYFPTGNRVLVDLWEQL